MFSVIIPLYNKSKWIGKCLQSVLNQTFLNFEVIVMNDGSTDDGEVKVQHIIEEFNEEIKQEEELGSDLAMKSEQRDNPLHLASSRPLTVGAELRSATNAPCKIRLINQPNMGVSTARNNGIEASKYNYIAFLDADDWWEPTYLQEMKDLIEKFPEAGIYSSNYYIFKDGKKKVAPVGITTDFRQGFINYFGVYAQTLCMTVWTGATIIPKKILLSENGFKPQLHLGEDFDLWIRIALKKPVTFLNRPLSNYNNEVKSGSRATSHLHLPEHHVLWNLDYLDHAELENPDLKLLLDRLRVYSLMPYYINKETRHSAMQHLMKVNWNKQLFSSRLKYKLPASCLKIHQEALKIGSELKTKLLKWM